MRKTRSLAYQAMLGVSIFACSMGLLFWGIHVIAAVKVTAEQRRQSVCSDNGRAIATLSIEKLVREKRHLPDDSFFNREDVQWMGGCRFTMSSRIKTDDGPRRFSADVHFEPDGPDWYIDSLKWSS